jgi:hypothetical protein
MRATILLALAAGALVLAPAMAGAAPNRCNPSASPATYSMAVVGDSLSVANDAWDDGCKTLNDYVGRLGNDWQSSWVIGDILGTTTTGYSIKKRLSAINGRAIKVVLPTLSGLGNENRNNNDGSDAYAELDTNGTMGSEVVDVQGGFTLSFGTLYNRVVAAYDSPIVTPHIGAGFATGPCKPGVDTATCQANFTNPAYVLNGPAQAQALVNTCAANPADCPQVVVLFLGGNDVCMPTCATVPAAATVQANIDSTTSILSQLPAGTEVWVSSLPPLQRMKTAMGTARNWVFRSCQDLWDLNTNAIDIVQCDNGILGSICNMTVKILEIVNDFVNFLGYNLFSVFGVNFPCASLLKTGSACGPTANGGNGVTTALNDAINAKLVSKFCYGGVDSDTYCNTGVTYGNVKFFLSRYMKSGDTAGIYFLDGSREKHLSTLDCFHFSRMGHEVMAAKVWKDFCDPGINAPVSCSGPSPDAASPGTVTTVYDTTNCPQPYASPWPGYCSKFTVTTTCAHSRVRLFIRPGSTVDRHDYGGTYFKESFQTGDTHVIYFNPPSQGGLYTLFYEVIDQTPNSGSYTAVKGRKYPKDTEDTNTHAILGHVGPQQVGSGNMYLY